MDKPASMTWQQVSDIALAVQLHKAALGELSTEDTLRILEAVARRGSTSEEIPFGPGAPRDMAGVRPRVTCRILESDPGHSSHHERSEACLSPPSRVAETGSRCHAATCGVAVLA